MLGKSFIDTNIVIYSLGSNSTKAHIAAPLFVRNPCISTQVLSETANVASKRLGLSVPEIRILITSLETICRVEIISLGTIHTALNLKEQYRFSWYDSLILATALNANCDTFYTEDLQHGQEISGRLRIVNPFV